MKKIEALSRDGSHPATVSLKGVIETSSTLHIIMELVTGGGTAYLRILPLLCILAYYYLFVMPAANAAVQLAIVELFSRVCDVSFYTEQAAATTIRLLAEGLSELHKHGIVHRDLKVFTCGSPQPRGVWIPQVISAVDPAVTAT